MGKSIHIKAGGEKVICTAYFQLGWLKAHLFRADQQYGRCLFEEDPSIWRGYVCWARPVADFVTANGPINLAARYCLWPFVEAWALEIAHRKEPEKLPCNLLGAVFCAVGIPVCRLIGTRATVPGLASRNVPLISVNDRPKGGLMPLGKSTLVGRPLAPFQCD